VKRQILLDTGPLVAYLDRRDKDHDWAAARWSEIEPPLLTCEAVLSEACFLLCRLWPGSAAVMELLDRGIIQIAFRLPDEAATIAKLMQKYATVPMSLADACLVRMAELRPQSAILTLDHDFRLYRKHGRHVVPVIMPAE